MAKKPQVYKAEITPEFIDHLYEIFDALVKLTLEGEWTYQTEGSAMTSDTLTVTLENTMGDRHTVSISLDKDHAGFETKVRLTSKLVADNSDVAIALAEDGISIDNVNNVTGEIVLYSNGFDLLTEFTYLFNLCADLESALSRAEGELIEANQSHRAAILKAETDHEKADKERDESREKIIDRLGRF